MTLTLPKPYRHDQICKKSKHFLLNTDTFVRKINVVMQSKKPQVVQALGMEKNGNIVNTH